MFPEKEVIRNLLVQLNIKSRILRKFLPAKISFLPGVVFIYIIKHMSLNISIGVSLQTI